MNTHNSKYSFKYNIGDVVYLRTDPDQNERIVTGIRLRQNSITYLISYNVNESEHFDFEIAKDANILKKLN